MVDEGGHDDNPASNSTGTANSGSQSDSEIYNLVIKCLSHEDFTLKIDKDKTILELKQQLHDTYPGKPIISSQKLIFGGSMLKDSMTLETSVKKVDRCEKYIMHFVCKSSITTPDAPPNASQNTRVAGQSASEPDRRQTLNNVTPQQWKRIQLDMYKQHIQSFKDNILPLMGPNHSIELNSLSKVLNLDVDFDKSDDKPHKTDIKIEEKPDSAPKIQSNDTSSSASTSVQTDSERPVAQEAPAEDPARPPVQPRQVEAQQARNIGPGLLNAGGFVAAADDNEQDNANEPDNDFLAWTYTFSRIAVLLAIVFFYSTLSRMMLVSLFGLLFFLLKHRWFPQVYREIFRRQHAHRPQNQIQNVPAEPVAQNRPADEAPVNPDVQGPQPVEGHPAPPVDQSNTSPTPVAIRRPSWFETVFVAITTFFISLFPIELREH